MRPKSEKKTKSTNFENSSINTNVQYSIIYILTKLRNCYPGIVRILMSEELPRHCSEFNIAILYGK